MRDFPLIRVEIRQVGDERRLLVDVTEELHGEDGTGGYSSRRVVDQPLVDPKVAK